MTGAKVITQPSTQTERWLVTTVERQAKAAGIGMPEVAIFNSPEVNAFATGMSRNNALVAHLVNFLCVQHVFLMTMQLQLVFHSCIQLDRHDH